ncbi:Protein RecT [Mycolicibacterium vanbaalenii]|uniref:Protein RecT n=1 Tax=Mycolicibacterium vanbaalenii TaxID=110539 RepID=A0A5S9R4I6_MYCVN|nr:recombinase RecT [Mycolicibacterium vanbaalenii]CAA0129282.1 Protein RecT [Mycolicibacterium vanbaalenii]
MTTTTEVATNEQKQPTLAQLIKQMEPEIAKALPSHMKPERMARIATTVLRQTPALARCTPESFLGALLTASQLGLEPGPIGESYFVPFGRDVTFIPGYRGLIKLARNSGQLVDIWAEIVYSNDEFDYTLGLHRDLKHVPAKGDRGEPTHVYAAAELKDGGHPFVVMTTAEVDAIRKRSRASSNGPWVTDWAAMARKTAVKQLSKWLPLSAEFNAASVLDGAVRTDLKSQVIDVAPDYDVDGEVMPDDQPAVEAPKQPAKGKTRSKAAEPPADEVFATADQLAKLKQIQDMEKYDDDGWRDFVAATIQQDRVEAIDRLTPEQAQTVIDLFAEEAAK